MSGLGTVAAVGSAQLALAAAVVTVVILGVALSALVVIAAFVLAVRSWQRATALIGAGRRAPAEPGLVGSDTLAMLCPWCCGVYLGRPVSVSECTCRRPCADVSYCLAPADPEVPDA